MNIVLKLRSMPAFLLRFPVYLFRTYANIRKGGAGRLDSWKAALALGSGCLKTHAKLLRERQGGVFVSVGTKSLIYGYHCAILHPFFVAWGWWKLFGFPWDLRLWVAFFVHDLGYWGKPNMDGPEGERHPHTGAEIMGALFDYRDVWGHPMVLSRWFTRPISAIANAIWGRCPYGQTWFCFTFYHSRFLAKSYGVPVSRLCAADKMAILLCPDWLQLLSMNATGEIREYMSGQGGRTVGQADQLVWLHEMKDVVDGWIWDQFDECGKCQKKTFLPEAEIMPGSYFSGTGEPSIFCRQCFQPVRDLAFQLWDGKMNREKARQAGTPEP